ncbi:hypothetical protein QBC34DRAFT_399373 [Podospora aff. communis PSN243]|uniref:CFEM domain-containing protein n=1 Tax=Podospora aff. communis PSN243 TaxID=3040156 RepID=A0AAV9GTE8_9PEZI|nr:hypothetical protein QBC34DRAFT_399373 [Podospora aff. communis PSN243]
MKLSALLCCLAAASTATTAATAWWKKKPKQDSLPDLLENSIFPKQPVVTTTRCIQGCLDSKHFDAGCGRADDWDCLCRSDHRTPYEIQSCVHSECPGSMDLSSLGGLEKARCGPIQQQAVPQNTQPADDYGYEEHEGRYDDDDA